MERIHSRHILYGLLAMAVLCNSLLWLSVRTSRERWLNIPPAPSVLGASLSGLGDRGLAYRVLGLGVQNFGDTGGRVISFKDFNYEELGRWMMLENSFDPHSDFMPMLAAYVYGGTSETSKLGPLVDYLEVAGDAEGENKWRWLAQAVFLARHKMKDYERAYGLAQKLAGMYKPGMPSWVLQMPAFVQNNRGAKEDALALMLSILDSEGDKLNPNEVNAMLAYICDQILKPDEAETYPLCEQRR
ncbi:MAG: hypothetical protein KDI46_06630 [Alphaproteobacteria bacterium]|nr:hypothetical protein [Alphaproteobacteria bacterium]